MPTKAKTERQIDTTQEKNALDNNQIKEIISRAINQIGQTILEQHPEIKIRDKKDE